MPQNAHNLKAILFDIDDTLIDTSGFSNIARNASIDALILGGLSTNREKIESELKRIIFEYGSNASNHFNILLEELKIPKEDRSRLISYALVAYHNAKIILHPIPDVPSTLMKLKEKNYKLYAASEGLSIKQWEKLIRSGIDRHIEHAFMTEDLSVKTKNSEFYKHILSKLNLEAKECLMIGDRIEKDIVPAKECGLNTIHVLTGRYNNNGVRCEESDYTVSNLSEIIDILPKIEEKIYSSR